MVTRESGTSDAECLSALVDGETGHAELLGACDAWRLDEATRATWHSYQLIGDVLRSEDLASSAGHDCSFLMAVRGRLAGEPVILSPLDLTSAAASAVLSSTHESLSTVAAEPAVLTRASRSTWLIPSAVTAGFVLVVGTFTVLRGDGPAPSTAVAAVDRVVAPRGTAASFDRPMAVASVNGPVLRDARLDRYLEAHKQFAGSSVLGAPSAFLRSATVDSSAR